MTILVLSRQEAMLRELDGYVRAFHRRGDRVILVDATFAMNGPISQLLASCPEPPALILHPESLPILPWGLTKVNIPTASFQIDSYTYTHRRVSWSAMFDLVFVFHPGYDAEFRIAGHPGAHFIPHAVDASFFSGAELERVFEVGWVGQTQGVLYRTRERILPVLSESFKMNDYGRRYGQEEMALVYRQSRIVVNIGRDDFPQDANLRVFEATAAGALLITALPTELTQIGFEDGVHFVGYRNEGELLPLIRRYLSEESSCRRIAKAAREKVLSEHTYDRRADTIAKLIESRGRKFEAPARSWSEPRVRLAYMDYFANNGAFDYAFEELQHLSHLSLAHTVMGIANLTRSWVGRSRFWMGRRKSRMKTVRTL